MYLKYANISTSLFDQIEPGSRWPLGGSVPGRARGQRHQGASRTTMFDGFLRREADRICWPFKNEKKGKHWQISW